MTSDEEALLRHLARHERWESARVTYLGIVSAVVLVGIAVVKIWLWARLWTLVLQ